MTTFELLADLPVEIKRETRRIQNKASNERTTAEAAVLTNYDLYINNKVVSRDASENVVIAQGTSLPTGYSGFAKGAQFLKTDVATGTQAMYENEGDTSAAVWNLVGEAESADLAVGLLRYRDTTVTVAQIKALAATNIELVPATEAGAGFAIVPIAVNLNFAAGSEVLTESADNLALRYSGSTELMVIETTGFLDAETDQNRYQAMAEAVMTPEENVAIDLDNNGDGEIAGNASDDCSLDVRVYYRVVPVL